MLDYIKIMNVCSLKVIIKAGKRQADWVREDIYNVHKCYRQNVSPSKFMC